MSLDWNDHEAVRRVMIDLRVAVDDVDALVRDMLAPMRSRELGHVSHRNRYKELRAQIVQMLAYAMPPPSDAGEGGAAMH